MHLNMLLEETIHLTLTYESRSQSAAVLDW